MTADVLIGIDAGTSVIKAVAFDTSGRQIGVASRPNSWNRLPDGGAEQDMSRTWADTVAVLNELVQRVEGLASRVIGIGVTGQGDGTWLIDAEGTPVHDGWLWLDARAAAEAADIERSAGIDTIYRTTGTGVSLCQMRAQLPWMRKHASDLLARAATAFHCKDWLYLNLTGQRATDPTEGVLTFGDYKTRSYSDDVVAALGLEDLRRLLPPIVDGARQTCPLSPAAAAAVGLPAGLPVALGYIDIACSGLGAGLYDPDADAGLTIIGSTGAHLRLARDASDVRLNTARTGYTLPLPGKALAQLQTNMAGTLNLDWALGLALQMLRSAGVERSRADLLAQLDDQILSARPGAAIFHPYISEAGERGPFSDPFARASFTGLSMQTGWGDILRAVCDGLVMAARDCYEMLGPMPREIRLGGGAARSPALRRLLSSGLGVPVRMVSQEEAGAAGAAMIAALALGLYPDAESASKAWVDTHLHPLQFPDAGLTRMYDSMFDAYRTTREVLPPVWAAQAAMRAALA